MTPTPDAILDNLSQFSDTELRVLLVVVRATIGWQKGRDWLTRREIERRTGRKRSAVSEAVGALVEGGHLIVTDEDGNQLATAEQRKRLGKARGKVFYALAENPLARNSGKTCPKSKQVLARNLVTTTNTHNNKHSYKDRVSILLDYLNERTNRSGPTAFKSGDGLRARLTDGATDDDVRLVIDCKIAEWQDSDKMRQFLKPATLFSVKHFPAYLTEAIDWDQRGRRKPSKGPKQAARSNNKYGHLVKGAK